jgi:hypothetical protein
LKGISTVLILASETAGFNDQNAVFRHFTACNFHQALAQFIR